MAYFKRIIFLIGENVMKKIRLLAIFIISIIAIGITASTIAALYRTSTHTDELILNDVLLSRGESSFSLDGSIISSGRSYRGFSYVIQNNKLLLTIYSGLVVPTRSNGCFSVLIVDGQLSTIQNIYIKHGEELTQIFP